ncbi:hypothetical protein BST61_g10259 [Cercospora zeina]
MTSITTLPPELVELVLWFLPTKDLLLSQRTCSQWRSLVQRSECLQQALFLKPEKPRLIAHYVNICRDGQPDKETYSLVPVTQAAMGRVSAQKRPENTSYYQEAKVFVGQFNPLLVSRINPPGSVIAEQPSICWDIASKRVSITLTSLSRHETLAQSAVWRRMHLSQPPTAVVEYTWRFLIPKRDRGNNDADREFHTYIILKSGAVENHAGVTMEDILDEIYDLEDDNGADFDFSNAGKTAVVGVVDLTADEALALRSTAAEAT